MSGRNRTREGNADSGGVDPERLPKVSVVQLVGFSKVVKPSAACAMELGDPRARDEVGWE